MDTLEDMVDMIAYIFHQEMVFDHQRMRMKKQRRPIRFFENVLKDWV